MSTLKEQIKHFLKLQFTLYPFQKASFEIIDKGENILVSAPTGSGKTLIAIYNITRTLLLNKKIIYTVPIKALGNQKYKELKEKFPDYEVGIMTGDIKENPNADILIMTAEILRNSISRENKEQVYEWTFKPDEIGCLVCDEFHFINDEKRGKVWENTITKLPQHIQICMLSATITGAEKIVNWIKQLKDKSCNLVLESERPVPLKHYRYGPKKKKNNNNGFELILDDKTWKTGAWDKVGKNILSLYNSHQLKNQDYYLFQCIEQLNRKNLLPATIFILSINKIIDISKKIRFNFVNKESLSQIKKLWNTHLQKYTNLYQDTEQFRMVKQLVEKGIGIHHSGLIPVLKEMIEILYSKKLLKILIATETFAMGLNMPTKTVIFTSLTKYDNKKRMLKPEEYIQMAGRAGRKGLDDFGQVIIISNRAIVQESIAKRTILAKPQEVKSKLVIDYSYILKLLSQKVDEKDESDILYYLEKNINLSLFANEHRLTSVRLKREISKMKSLNFDKVDLSKYDEYLKLHDIIINPFINLSNKDKKKYRKIKKSLSIPEKDILRQKNQFEEYQKKKNEFDLIDSEFKTHIKMILKVLIQYRMVDIKNQITELGRIVSEVHECNPIILGKMISDNMFDDLEFNEIVAFVSIFITDRSLESISIKDLDISDILYERMSDVNSLCFQFMDIETKLNHQIPFVFHSDWKLHLTLFKAVNVWALGKSWRETSQFYKSHEGNFIKNMLRLVNLIRNIENIAKLTNNTKLLDKIDGYQEKLIRDFVITDSLYV